MNVMKVICVMIHPELLAPILLAPIPALANLVSPATDSNVTR